MRFQKFSRLKLLSVVPDFDHSLSLVCCTSQITDCEPEKHETNSILEIIAHMDWSASSSPFTIVLFKFVFSSFSAEKNRLSNCLCDSLACASMVQWSTNSDCNYSTTQVRDLHEREGELIYKTKICVIMKSWVLTIAPTLKAAMLVIKESYKLLTKIQTRNVFDWLVRQDD